MSPSTPVSHPRVGRPLTILCVAAHVVETDGGVVDQDALLMRNYFNMSSPVEAMSPIITPPGFFKSQDYLTDSTKARQTLERQSLDKIKAAFSACSEETDCMCAPF